MFENLIFVFPCLKIIAKTHLRLSLVSFCFCFVVKLTLFSSCIHLSYSLFFFCSCCSMYILISIKNLFKIYNIYIIELLLFLRFLLLWEGKQIRSDGLKVVLNFSYLFFLNIINICNLKMYCSCMVCWVREA